METEIVKLTVLIKFTKELLKTFKSKSSSVFVFKNKYLYSDTELTLLGMGVVEINQKGIFVDVENVSNKDEILNKVKTLLVKYIQEIKSNG